MNGKWSQWPFYAKLRIIYIQKRIETGGGSGSGSSTGKNNYESVWDIEVAGSELLFKHTNAENNTNPETETKLMISGNQTIANIFNAKK